MTGKCWKRTSRRTILAMWHHTAMLPSDAPFLAECILAGMHLYDFEEFTTVL